VWDSYFFICLSPSRSRSYTHFALFFACSSLRETYPVIEASAGFSGHEPFSPFSAEVSFFTTESLGPIPHSTMFMPMERRNEGQAFLDLDDGEVLLFLLPVFLPSFTHFFSIVYIFPLILSPPDFRMERPRLLRAKIILSSPFRRLSYDISISSLPSLRRFRCLRLGAFPLSRYSDRPRTGGRLFFDTVPRPFFSRPFLQIFFRDTNYHPD